MGFLPFLAALFGGIASIAPTVASIAGSIASVKMLTGGSGGSSSAPNPQATAAAIAPDVLAALQARGIMLPQSQAQAVVHAGLLDSLSPGSQQLLLFAGLGLVALMVLK